MGISCSKSTESDPVGDTNIVLDTEGKKVSYAMGFNIGTNLKMISNDLEYTIIVKGIKDSFEGSEPLMSQEQIQNTLQSFQQRTQLDQMNRRKKMAEINKAEADKFFADNAKQEGVKVTKSGLQYKVITPAKGPKPKSSDTIKVQYIGTLLNGTEFDSSYRRGTPAQFQLGKVIGGWIEGIQLMNVGSKYRFYIPSALAYKESGSPPTIGPNAALIFDVELLEIVKPEANK